MTWKGADYNARIVEDPGELEAFLGTADEAAQSRAGRWVRRAHPSRTPHSGGRPWQQPTAPQWSHGACAGTSPNS